jgi:hypothetical protein
MIYATLRQPLNILTGKTTDVISKDRPHGLWIADGSFERRTRFYQRVRIRRKHHLPPCGSESIERE